MTEMEAEGLAAKLTRVWMPDGSFGEGAGWSLREGEFEYRAQITDELEMWFGSSPLCGGVGFHLKRTQEGRTTGSLYCARNGSHVQSAVAAAGESEEEFARFAGFYGPIMRSYCWLSGCPIESSASEQESWRGWLQEREDTGQGEATHAATWEVQRIATAFEVEAVTVVRIITGVHYEGWCGDVRVTWALGDPNARMKSVQVGDRSYCGIYLAGGQWEWEPGQEGHELIAKGLYRLGFEEERLLTQLDHPLTGHEKLELRLSMPREFWPQTWVDEVG